MKRYLPGVGETDTNSGEEHMVCGRGETGKAECG